MDADPTMDLVAALMREDASEWGVVIKGMPIFVEHHCYEMPPEFEGAERKLIVVPFGDEPPENGKLLYSVDAARLRKIAEEINKNLTGTGTPMKLFIGHSNPKLPQAQNPPIVGFGRGAYMGTFGPSERVAIKTDAFFKHGHENAATEYPQRSPEFVPRTNAISGVALLKTDPRLPMGMLAFASDETVLYGVGFMADEPEKKAEKPAEEKPAAKPAPKEADKDGDGVPDKVDPDIDGDGTPNELDADADGDGIDDEEEEFGPHEVKFAGRMMKHLEANHPAIKYMCEQHKKYAETQAAMVAPSATDGTPPIGQPKKPKPDEERIDMADTTTATLAALQEQVKSLQHDKAILYAEQETTKLIGMGVKIADPTKFKARLVAGTPEQRLELITDARVNYAREDRAPIGDFLPLNADAGAPVEGPQRTEADLEPAEVSEVIQYAEANGIDASTTQGWKKAMQAVFGKDKKSA